MKHFIVIFALIIGLSLTTYAQKGTIKGFVTEEVTGEEVPYATVRLLNTKYVTTTDLNGFFTFAKLPNGPYELVVTFVGFDADTTSIEIKGQQSIDIKLVESAVVISDVTVDAKRIEAKTESKVSQLSISSKMINKLPTIGGEADLAQYLQLVPGVTFTGDQGGQLYIRGGTPVQTKFLLDGVTVYNPIHSIGLFSVYETEIIKNVDVYTGGFGAQFGNRISAVVDVTTRDGNKKRWGGLIAANPFVSKAIIEGPLIKQREDGSSMSVLFTAKHSYIDKIGESIYPYVEGGIPYSFTDYFGKISFTSKGGSKGSAFGFSYSDTTAFSEQAQYAWNAAGGGLKIDVVSERSDVVLHVKMNYSQYEVRFHEEGFFDPRRSGVGNFETGFGATYFIPQGRLDFGLELTGFSTEFEFVNPFNVKVEENQQTTEIGFFLQMNKRIGKLVLEPGFRIHYYGSLGEPSLEPRFSAKYNAADKFRLKFAGGLFSQNLISTRSDKDIVNLFNGFLSGTEDRLETFDGEETNTNLQKAAHLVAGVEIDIFDNATLNAETYYKRFYQLIGFNRFKRRISDPNFATQTGNAYGIDLSMKYDFDRIFAYATYSLSRSTRNDGNQIFPPHFDRTHNINLFGSYTLGKEKTWEVSARFNFGTGFPFTKTQNFFEKLNLNSANTGTINTGNGSLGIVFDDEINGGRLPYFHRLDISGKKKFRISEHTRFELTASLSNVYNRDNLFYQDRITGERVNQLPILPSIGASLKF